MNEDNKELVEYLDKKFNNVDEKFKTLSDIFVTKDEFKAAVETLSTKADFNDLQTSVDAYAVKADKYFQEMTMLTNKVDRHDKWLLQIAEKLGIKLQY